MSKPDINGLGICAELTLHEKALRKAQHEIDELRGENARLRRDNQQLNDRIRLRGFHAELREALGQDENPLAAKSIHLPPIPAPNPPHYSTVGLGIDGEGRVQG